MLGRELETVVPVAFLPEKHALAIAIFSYNGKMSFGLLGDFDAMDDIDVVEEGLEEALRELVAAADARRPPKRARRRATGSGTHADPCRIAPRPWNNGAAMDPRRKRTIRLVIALSVAVLLGGALIYTSFSAATETRQPSELLAGATPGKSYELTGKVAHGTVGATDDGLLFRVRDRTRHRVGAGALLRRGAGPVPRGPRGDPQGQDGQRPVRGREGQPDHEVPVEVLQEREDLA